MCQTQLMSSVNVSELMQSMGLELAIFAITFAFAVAFRGTLFGKNERVKPQKSTSKPLANARPTEHGKQPLARNADNKKVSNTPSPRMPSSPHKVSDRTDSRVESMIACASRRQAADAIAIYEDLRASGQSSSLKDFMNTDVCKLLAQCAGRLGRPDLVEMILDDMVKAGIDRPLGFYEDAMKMLASKKCYKEAISVFGRLEADGLEPSAVTLSSLVHFAVEIGESARAIDFFNRLAMTSTPSIRAYMTILRVHGGRQDWAKSLAVIRDMQQRQAPIDSLVLNVVLATGVSSGQLNAAEALLDEFSKNGLADVVSFNTLLKGLAQQKEVDRALKVLDEMLQTKAKPNAITFNTAIDAAVRSGRVTDAWGVLTRMCDAGLSPDKFTCTTLMKGLQNGATSGQLIVILDLLQNVTAECDSSLLGFLFRNVIEAAARVGDPSMTARAVAQMREQRVMLPPQEYHRLLRVLMQDGERKQSNPISRQSPLEAVRVSVGLC